MWSNNNLRVGHSYVYGWNRMGRKGQVCVLEIIGGKNSVQVQFQDGYQAITSRNALRELMPESDLQPSFFS
jgi:hypothetical protein